MRQNELEDVLRSLTELQLRFVALRINHQTDADAARELGMNPISVSNWKTAGAPIDQAIALIRMDGVVAGRERLRRLVTRAVDVLASQMSHRDPRIAQAAAVQVLDRAGVAESLTIEAGDNLADLLRQWRKPATDEADDEGSA